ncbi:hypothetical protein PTE30175_03791 [Pandoraea terrae]|uniref:DUF1571 domain-containing protein n=1 Tax=Pandoraea terrae TaxID=1537710 RepID=A0A5E4XHJ9_9BURK|nr:hypothetical protein [Pandoraea terrae]VVE35756.1 hypothetical protein PTE30175_03791 [Pandoraea terrae]
MLTFALAAYAAVALSTAGTHADPLAAALARFDALTAYRVTLRSTDGHARQELRYVYKKPGWVRMEFVTPHPGAALVYNPQTREVTLWPRGPDRFPTLLLSPDNPLLRGPHGHRVNHADVGEMLTQARMLATRGTLIEFGTEIVGGRPARHVAAIDADTSGVTGAPHRFDIWLSLDAQFPMKVETTDAHGKRIETVLMDDAEIDPVLPAALFETRTAGSKATTVPTERAP